MFGILLSALNSVASFFLRSVIVKFALYFALYFLTTEFISLIEPLLPSAGNLNNAFVGVPSSVWYFLDLFAFSQGLPLVISATVTRFVVRRLPIIG